MTTNVFKTGDIVRIKPSHAVSPRLCKALGRDFRIASFGDYFHRSADLVDVVTGDILGKVHFSRLEHAPKKIAADEIKVGTYIISLQKPDGTLLPAEKPKQYGSDDQANKIAKLMAKKHGGRFVVFKAVSQYEMPVAEPVYRAL